MEFANHLILIGSGLILISIFAGMISSRFGAPLLLVFLVLGMLAGEDGPGGIDFDDFGTTYLVGSIALAIILFDGGLRTRVESLRKVAAPALVLASAGVVVTAAVTGAAASFLLGIGWLEGLLLGSIVASTDAAAVFLLLHLRGLRLRERLSSTLEAEAGLNDPMAVLLTITCVSLLGMPEVPFNGDTAVALVGTFVLQMVGGATAGLAGGYLLLFMINRIQVAAGLYPIVVTASVLSIFAASQTLGASGFLAAYLMGLTVGNRNHKSSLQIDRFHDGLAWLSQIAMFLMLGLLVTPSELLPVLLPAVVIALALMLVARPLAVALCLPWFGFKAREIGFVSWVGLRGAVPIFLGTIPVLAGLDHAAAYFGVVYVVVLVSLIFQGWSIGLAGRKFGVVLPPRPEAPPRVALNLPSGSSRDMLAYSVRPKSLALKRNLARLPLPEKVDLVSIMREGKLLTPVSVKYLNPGDDILLLAPPAALPVLDRLFGERVGGFDSVDAAIMGAFVFNGSAPLESVADAYGLRLPTRNEADTIGAFVSRNLPGRLRVGRRLRVGGVEFVIGELSEGRVKSLSIDLEPKPWSLRLAHIPLIWCRAMIGEPLASLAARMFRKKS